MNRRFLIIAAAILVARFSAPAAAGRDAGQMMQQEQANKAAAQQRAQDLTGCDKAGARLALPLDHGLRAETAPWLNQQRRLQVIEKCRQQARAAPK
jgi:hypothetical protein